MAMKSGFLNIGDIATYNPSVQSTSKIEQLTKDKISPLPNIDTVIFLGASIFVGVVGSKEVMIQNELSRYGIDVTVVDAATAGNTISGTQSEWDGISATYAGQSNVLVVIHALGNDVSLNRPWSGLTEAQQNSLVGSYKTLIDSVVSNGNVPLIFNTSHRNYDDNNYLAEYEDNGSKPFNENVLYRVARSLVKSNWYEEKPYVDWYEYTRNLALIGHPIDDPIHWTNKSYLLLAGFAVRNIANRINGLPPFSVARVEDVTKVSAEPTNVMLYFSSETGRSYEIMGAKKLWGDLSSAVTGYEMYDLENISVTSITCDFDPAGWTFSSQTWPTSGDKSKSLYNDAVKSGCIYTSNSSLTDIVTLHGFNAGQTGIIKVAGWRTSTGSTRTGVVTVDNGKTEYLLNGGNDSTNNVIEFPFTADENGDLTLQGRQTTGFLIISGIEIALN